MGSKRGRLIGVLCVILVVVLVILVAQSGLKIKEIDKLETSADNTVADTPSGDKNTVKIWYTDESLTDYLNSIAVTYNSEQEEVRVVPELVSGMEYLESISKASVEGKNYPDLYITTNDMLEKAHLAGLADEIRLEDGVLLDSYFPSTAVDSVTYLGEQIAYPLYFECSALLYNDTYLKQWARNTLEAEIRSEIAAAEDGENKANQSTATKKPEEQSEEEKKAAEEAAKKAEEELAAQISAQVSEEDVQAYVNEYFPTTYEKLLTFSNDYDAPEGVDTVFKWAVTDIFYNYFFIGDATNVGGKYGDDKEQIDIYNESAIQGLQDYQDLNHFFSISTDDVSYAGVIQEFIDGEIVLTIATSDSVKKLKEAEAEGNISFDYNFAMLPNIHEGVEARSMSVTDVIAVNGYSENQDIANAFALYLCTQDGVSLYDRTGKTSSLSEVDYPDEVAYLNVFKSEYERSVPLPKMLETSNFWTELELLFASVWDGADANAGLKALSEQMKLQVTGTEVIEDPIVIEEEIEEEDEIIEVDTLDEGA